MTVRSLRLALTAALCTGALCTGALCTAVAAPALADTLPTKSDHRPSADRFAGRGDFADNSVLSIAPRDLRAYTSPVGGAVRMH